MSQGRTILSLLRKRVDALSALKESLLHQQHALLENQPHRLEAINVEQVAIMEDIQALEVEWATLKKQLQNSSAPAVDPDYPYIQYLSDDELLEFEQLKTQVRALGEEIQRLKENNQALIENSLGFVRAVLRSVETGVDSQAVYRPGRQRPRQRNIVLDKTL